MSTKHRQRQRRPRPLASNFLSFCVALIPFHASSGFTAFVSSRQRRHTPPFVLKEARYETTATSSMSTTLFTSATATTKTSTPFEKYNLTLVLIDHYDSYTYNLYDMVASLCLEPPVVLAKDAYPDWHALQQDYPSMDGLILSPGPGRPTCPNDMGLTLDAIRKSPHLPILGVCLGHQALGHVYGANVTLAPCGPVHGQVLPVHRHASEQEQQDQEDPLWVNVPNPIHVTRYHSLVVQLPPHHDDHPNELPLVPTAWCEDVNHQGDKIPILMGLSHTTYPHYGVQFHPESIGTPHGRQLLHNFLEICHQHKQQQVQVQQQQQPILEQQSIKEQQSNNKEPPSKRMDSQRKVTLNTALAAPRLQKSDTNGPSHKRLPYEICIQKLSNSQATPEQVFTLLYGNATHAVWLDSSNSESGAPMARCSIMAGMDGPLSRLVEYYGVEHATQRRLQVVHKDPERMPETMDNMDILSYLRQECSISDSVTMVSPVQTGTRVIHEDECDLPFEYRGGFLGYLGYEVRHDTQRILEQQEHAPTHEQTIMTGATTCNPKVPTAAFLFADQSLVYDHWEKDWYLVGVARKGQTESVSRWMETVGNVIQNWKEVEPTKPSRIVPTTSPLVFIPNRSRERYRQDIVHCHEQIRMGESYELCLTNQLEATVPIVSNQSPLQLYQILRRRNPAPFAAFLRFHGHEPGGAQVSICCSSPERFVSVQRKPPDSKAPRFPDTATAVLSDGGNPIRLYVEAKPIKGTCAREVLTPPGRDRTTAEQDEDMRRARELEFSVKNRAENLMIVDLLRNDLSRVCQVGSVHVSSLMHIESYATVHQLVSTIRGTLDSKKSDAMDVLSACFPGGSMTGAPKLRTMDILDGIEECVSRGPYSGSLGYVSLNGSMDMNIIIRTAVLTLQQDDDDDCLKNDASVSWKVRIGAGGAITALSESDDEYEEMLLKARAVVEAVQAWSALTTSDHEQRRQQDIPIPAVERGREAMWNKCPL